MYSGIGFAITAIKDCLAQPEQEPVAFVKGWNCGRLEVIVRSLNQRFEIDQPLYTTPPQRKPLTDEELRNHYQSNEWLDGVRFTEQFHGIKGEA